ncbi:hypothetical protein GMORB2_0607 [Geosmithia morbida]|uniref:Uncharacterized protein n=1 Tax=Geosmithia morbida TaxID=1094350 RepID=A0A9P4Z1I7_9HYPO|nr:uncharacterized protein GMORB2_0607 [Geosmithia morbida]KAF4126870.1 hypothetical protein GMORB2_0607 [Geosmithia morbida]
MLCDLEIDVRPDNLVAEVELSVVCEVQNSSILASDISIKHMKDITLNPTRNPEIKDTLRRIQMTLNGRFGSKTPAFALELACLYRDFNVYSTGSLATRLFELKLIYYGMMDMLYSHHIRGSPDRNPISRSDYYCLDTRLIRSVIGLPPSRSSSTPYLSSYLDIDMDETVSMAADARLETVTSRDDCSRGLHDMTPIFGPGSPNPAILADSPRTQDHKVFWSYPLDTADTRWTCKRDATNATAAIPAAEASSSPSSRTRTSPPMLQEGYHTPAAAEAARAAASRASRVGQAQEKPMPAPPPPQQQQQQQQLAGPLASIELQASNPRPICQDCGYRPSGDPHWYAGSMTKHRKTKHAAENTIFQCPYPGCPSKFTNRADNLRQHQIKKKHFIDTDDAGSSSGRDQGKRRKKMSAV